MIYAIEATGSGFVKFGMTARGSPLNRLEVMQTGCPYELVVRATAMWPDREEFRIHRYLADERFRGEWFKLVPRTERVIEVMNHGDINAWFDLLYAGSPSRLRRVLRSC